MTSPSTGPVPPGWYPDPGGEQQWRIWTGRDWSVVTRPFDAPGASEAPPLSTALGVVTAVHRLARYGVVAVFAGLGLLVSVLAHWPGSTHPINAAVAATLLATALALLILGTASYALAGRELVGRWTPALLLPGVNVFVVSSLVAHALGEAGPFRRIGVDVALVAFYVLECRAHPYLSVVPALVSLDLVATLSRLGHQLVGAAAPRKRAS